MRIKWRRKAFPEMRLSPEVLAEIARRGQAMASACGDGFEADARAGKNRARSIVYADTIKAKRQDAKRNVILSNVDAARG